MPFGELIRDDVPHDKIKQSAAQWFEELGARICSAYESIEREAVERNSPVLEKIDGKRERAGTFTRCVTPCREGGKNILSIMHGRVFEKVGINISSFWGTFSPEFRRQLPGAEEDPRFYTTGITVVAHPCNPHVPAGHFNARLTITTQGWFRGGCNITPTFPDSDEAHEDADFLKKALKECCDAHHPEYFQRYTEWCKEYFYLHHRQELRSMGGIFYDWLRTKNIRDDLALTQDLGLSWLNAHPEIVRRRMMRPWTAQERMAQLVRRGRYAEHALLGDRNILFKINTGENPESVLMTLPPEAAWP